MKNIKSRIAKISMINASYFAKNNNITLEKESNQLKKSLSKEVRSLIDLLEDERIKSENNIQVLSEFFTSLKSENIIKKSERTIDIDYNSIKKYDKYNYDTKILEELLKDYLYNTKDGYEITRHAGFTKEEQEHINLMRMYDKLYHEPSTWHTFLGYEEDVRNTMLYTPPAAEYGDKLSWNDFCIRSDEKECCIEALYQAYIYNKIKKDYINKVLKELCKYLGHDYVNWKEDTNYLCKCPNCGSVKKVSSDIYYHNKKRRIINPGREIEDYINYVSSINISDLSNIDKKDFIINDDYFKDPKMKRHLKLGELIKI